MVNFIIPRNCFKCVFRVVEEKGRLLFLVCQPPSTYCRSEQTKKLTKKEFTLCQSDICDLGYLSSQTFWLDLELLAHLSSPIQTHTEIVIISHGSTVHHLSLEASQPP